MASHLKPLKISYCTTCKGRLHHLQQTLPANLKAEEGNPNVEFLVLDYGSEDGLGDWIRENFQKEIASGRLIYARTEAEYFKMAHAKNMAHRLATGDILCNVDADNFIGRGFSNWLKTQFLENPDTIVSTHPVELGHLFVNKLDRLMGRKPSVRIAGIGGRIAIGARDFNRLGGYDEDIEGWGPDDVNITMRARDEGLAVCTIPSQLVIPPITHADTERLSNLSADAQKKSSLLISRPRHKKMLATMSRIVTKYDARPNADDVGCGDVHINFADEITTIGPLSPLEAKVAPVNETTPPDGTSNFDGITRRNWAITLGGATPLESNKR